MCIEKRLELFTFGLVFMTERSYAAQTARFIFVPRTDLQFESQPVQPWEPFRVLLLVGNCYCICYQKKNFFLEHLFEYLLKI